jgi:hypothetical protein
LISVSCTQRSASIKYMNIAIRDAVSPNQNIKMCTLMFLWLNIKMSVFWDVAPYTDTVDEFALLSFLLDKLFCLLSFLVTHLVS